MTRSDPFNSKFDLHIDLDRVPSADRAARVARLLRNVADRIDEGHTVGGFHFGLEDSTPGGFAFLDDRFNKKVK